MTVHSDFYCDNCNQLYNSPDRIEQLRANNGVCLNFDCGQYVSGVWIEDYMHLEEEGHIIFYEEEPFEQEDPVETPE